MKMCITTITTIINVIILLAIGWIHFSNYELAKRKRNDDLAGKRYGLYKKFALWLWSEENEKAFRSLTIDKKDKIMQEWANEFRTIYPQDISDYINSIMDLTEIGGFMRGDIWVLFGNHESFDGMIFSSMQAEDAQEFKSFFEPFEKYLKFEE